MFKWFLLLILVASIAGVVWLGYSAPHATTVTTTTELLPDARFPR